MINRVFLFLLLIAPFYGQTAASAEDDANSDELTVTHPTERIVFSTEFGDMVFALYPKLAPVHVKHFKKLVELKLYENVYVARVIKDFVFQFSEILKRPEELSELQKNELRPIKAEFSTVVKHQRGVLSMARKNNQPDSGTSSFSVILGNAAHLDGKYTIFGEMESGWNVINKVLASSINGVTPAHRVYVKKAMIVDDIGAYYKTHIKDIDTYVAPKADERQKRKTVDTKRIVKQSEDSTLKAVATLTAMTIVIALIGILLHDKWSKNHLRSLMTLMVLVSGFSLLIMLMTIDETYTWMGAVFFVVLVGMFRVMSRFEN